MTETILQAQCHGFQILYDHCGPRQCVSGDPKDIQPPSHLGFVNSTHAHLKVNKPDSPVPGPILVNVFNGYKGVNVSLELDSSDTIGKLKQMFLEMKPDFGGSVDLAYNGKPVEAHQTLAELQVKPGATFITFQRCHGG